MSNNYGIVIVGFSIILNNNMYITLKGDVL